MSTNLPKRILILGGGFAGLYAAMELEETLAPAREVEITLVNRENFFLFTPMLHEVAASDLDISPPSSTRGRSRNLTGSHRTTF